MNAARLGATAAAELTALTEHVGWTHVEADWRDYLAVGKVWGHRTERGDLASCAALFDYDSALASIGLVIVHESQRGRGLAGELMRCAAAASRARTLTLIATPFGLPVYEHLGYRPVDSVTRMVGTLPPPAVARSDGWTIRPMANEDFARVLELDRSAWGADRSAVLGRLRTRTVAAFCAEDAAGEVVGSVMALPKTGQIYLGPLVAPQWRLAEALIDAVAAQAHAPLRIDVPRAQVDLQASLAHRGLLAMSENPVMTFDGRPLPGERRLVHSIAFQALG